MDYIKRILFIVLALFYTNVIYAAQNLVPVSVGGITIFVPSVSTAIGVITPGPITPEPITTTPPQEVMSPTSSNSGIFYVGWSMPGIGGGSDVFSVDPSKLSKNTSLLSTNRVDIVCPGSCSDYYTFILQMKTNNEDYVTIYQGPNKSYKLNLYNGTYKFRVQAVKLNELFGTRYSEFTYSNQTTVNITQLPAPRISPTDSNITEDQIITIDSLKSSTKINYKTTVESDNCALSSSGWKTYSSGFKLSNSKKVCAYISKSGYSPSAVVQRVFKTIVYTDAAGNLYLKIDNTYLKLQKNATNNWSVIRLTTAQWNELTLNPSEFSIEVGDFNNDGLEDFKLTNNDGSVKIIVENSSNGFVIENKIIQSTYKYDARGRLIKVTSGTKAINYEYDNASNRTKINND